MREVKSKGWLELCDLTFRDHATMVRRAHPAFTLAATALRAVTVYVARRGGRFGGCYHGSKKNIPPTAHPTRAPAASVRARAGGGLAGLVARLGGRALFTFVIARVLRRFPAYTSRHMARLAGRVTVDDVTTLRTTAYRYTSRAQSATREPM